MTLWITLHPLWTKKKQYNFYFPLMIYLHFTHIYLHALLFCYSTRANTRFFCTFLYNKTVNYYFVTILGHFNMDGAGSDNDRPTCSACRSSCHCPELLDVLWATCWQFGWRGHSWLILERQRLPDGQTEAIRQFRKRKRAAEQAGAQSVGAVLGLHLNVVLPVFGHVLCRRDAGKQPFLF